MSALKNTATGDTSKKPQRIHTPACILDPLKKLWPDGIQMDPCGSPDSIVEAKVTICPETGGDGLAVDWPDGTFINPPYKHLKAWMLRRCQQDEITDQVWLVPVRPHRKWWRAFRRGCDAMVWLNPIKFHGYSQSFPAPLALMYTGRDPEGFLELYEDLGGGELL